MQFLQAQDLLHAAQTAHQVQINNSSLPIYFCTTERTF